MAQQQLQHQNQSPPFTIEISGDDYVKYGAVHDDLIAKLRGLSPENRELALRALMWLSCARRPLATGELGYALAFTEDTTRRLDKPSHTNAARLRAACSACAGFISERKESILVRHIRDEQDFLGYVYNVKPSISLTDQVAEYFTMVWKCWFPHAHHDIATACLRYVSLEAFGTEEPPTDEYEFYPYAAQNWGYHAEMQPVPQSLVMDFLENEKKVLACSKYLPLKRVCGCCIVGKPKTITKLHLAVYFGLDDIVRYLVEAGAELDVKDGGEGRTPLSWAVELGRSSIAKYLLNHGADANMPERLQNTLGWAIVNGDPSLFQVLIGYGARPGCALPTWEDILLRAAIQGQEDIIGILIDRGVDWANFRDCRWGRSPISQAAEYGRENVVKLLLDHGADPNSKDINGDQRSQRNDGKTPFTWVVQNSHTAVVNLLIRHGACPGPIDPMAHVSAAIRDQYNLSQYLLEQNVSPIIHEPNFGRSPLSQAAEYGRDNVTKLLLDWGVDPNMRDINGKNTTQNNEGKTPLMWASMNGHLSIVKLLLDRGADRNLQERDGRAALSWAAERGRTAVVQTLLQRGADANQSDTYHCQTPISWAAMNGHRDVVMLLLIHGADALKKDRTGQTALDRASTHKHQAIVPLLLERGLPRPCRTNGHEMTTFQCKPFEYAPLPTPDPRPFACYPASRIPLRLKHRLMGCHYYSIL